jgi:beta-lactam-binding protein with PASTA domain
LNRRFVPLVEGELFESAQRILKRQGFSLGEVKESSSERYAAGTVISQDPPGYQEGSRAKAIKIVLSTGHPGGSDVMPDLVGRDIAEVNRWLEQKNLPASSIRHVVHAGAPEGMVVRQTPRPGAETKGSGKIAFYVSKGKQP